MEQEPQDAFPNRLITQELTSKHRQVSSAGVFFPSQIQRSTQQTWVSLQWWELPFLYISLGLPARNIITGITWFGIEFAHISTCWEEKSNNPG